MKCVRCPNHNLQHDISEKPSDSPTDATCDCGPSIYQDGVASLLDLLPYEYELDMVPQS